MEVGPNPTTLRLSILDQSPIPEGSTAGDALRNTIDLARLADQRGYYRYWLAEHHGTPALACQTPEILIGLIAAATANIRVGSGGIMLPHYSPLKIAENFSILESLYPGRIDLGIGRAAGTSPAIAFALQRDRRQRAPDDFTDQLGELLLYFGRLKPSDEPFPQIITSHIHFSSPDLFLLGSSLQSAIWAADLDIPYVFADFINPDGRSAAEYYYNHFVSSERMPKPRLAVAVWAICAPTNDAAQQLSLPLRMMMTLLQRGRLIAVPGLERAERFVKKEGVPADMLPFGRRIIAGDPARVCSQIKAVAAEYCAEEVLIVNIMHDHASRRRSYELIAREFELVNAAENEAPYLTAGL